MLISCLIAAAPLLGATAADDAFALRASHVHVGDGQVVLDAFVVVEDGVVKSLNVEESPGQAERSTAEAVLEQL